MKSVKYLDAVMERHGLKTDKALCAHMGWSHSAVNNYRKGLRIMDNEQCLRVALELGMENPLPIIMAADADRAERAGQRSLWEVFSPRMAHSGLAAVLVALGLSVTNFVTPSPAKAASLSHSAGSTLCIMLNIGSTGIPPVPIHSALRLLQKLRLEQIAHPIDLAIDRMVA